MTTNTNPSRTTARFFAAAAPVDGLFPITDRTDNTVVASVKGRAAARTMAATLSAIDPAPREAEKPMNLRDTKKAAKAAKAAAKPKAAKATKKAEPKADAVRTSHADCAHVSTKLARAICRRDRAKADTKA